MLLVHNNVMRTTVTDHQEALLREARMHRLAAAARAARTARRVVHGDAA